MPVEVLFEVQMSESSTSSVWSPRVRVYVPDARSAELKTNDWHS